MTPPDRSSPKGTPLTEGSWNDLYDFLDPHRRDRRGPDRDRDAERRCREIERKLVCYFVGHTCGEAEDLATETLLRVAARCGSIETTGLVDRTHYFYGVARNVLHEWHRHELRDSGTREALKNEYLRERHPDPRSWDRTEAAHRCLDLCTAKLTHRARELILRYYGQDGEARIEQHRKLAGEFGKSINGLRIESYRIRKNLRECVMRCVAPTGERFVPEESYVSGGQAGHPATGLRRATR
jgi:RNA polymerase sigma factor (sigma-70 family)